LPKLPPPIDKVGSTAIFSNWQQDFNKTVDDLMLKSNVHNCDKYTTKSGRKRKDKDSHGCKDNKWRRCKARFPRPLFAQTTVDEDSGAINIRNLRHGSIPSLKW